MSDLIKTDKEILERIKEVAQADFFGAQRGDLVRFLSYENAKEFLTPETTEEDWSKCKLLATKENVVKEILDYIPFAFDKANNCRGLSASRSMDHMKGWLWLLDDKELISECENYSGYGKPQLQKISEKYGFDCSDICIEVEE